MTAIRRTLAAAVLALFAPFMFVLPAHADEPVDDAPTPEDACAWVIDDLTQKVEFWRGLAHAGFEAQDARVRLAEQLGTRTHELFVARAEVVRVSARRDRLARQRDRLAAKVAELRERLASR